MIHCLLALWVAFNGKPDLPFFFTPENLLHYISIKKWEFYRRCHEDNVMHVGRTLLAHALLNGSALTMR